MNSTTKGLASLIIKVLIYAAATGLTIYWLLHPEPGTTIWGSLLGLAGAIVGWRIARRSWGAFVLTLGLLVALGHYASDTFNANLGYGITLWLLLTVVLPFLYGLFIVGPRQERRRKTAAGGRKLLGLSGYSGSGKDTAALGLFWDAKAEWVNVSFSDTIRAFLYKQNPHILTMRDGLLNEWTLHNAVDLYGWDTVKRWPEVLELQQRTGEFLREVFGENVIIDATMRRIPAEGNLVFTSLRFPNEAQAVVDAGGKVVRVTRPGVEAVNGHITEHALDDWDFDAELINDATPHTLGVALRRLAYSLFPTATAHD